MNTIFIVIPILTLLMFDIGLTLTSDDFKMIAKRPKAVWAGIIGQIVLLPLIAFVLGAITDIQPVFLVGLMLIACSPGGSSSNVFSMLAGGDVALSVTLTAFSSIITLVTLPFIMAAYTSFLGTQANIALPVGNLIVQNIVLMAVPIVAGLLLRKYKNNMSSNIHKVLKKVAFPAIILLASVFFIQNRQVIIQEFTSLGTIITIFILLAMAAGLALSLVMRLKTSERRTIIIEVGMQNAAQAITVACSPLVFNNETIAVPAIIYALMMNVILIIYISIAKRIHVGT